MGGTPPLGYDVKDRNLIINEAEAERVRFLFRRYLELGSIQLLADDLPKHGIISKSWISQSGRERVGKPMWPGHVAAVLSNPLYRGLIAHRDKTYPGRHEAIVDDELWNAVQAHRAEVKAKSNKLPRLIDGPLLVGLAKDDAGNAMHLHQKRKGGRLYRYYVSAGLDGGRTPGSLPRVAAAVLDRLVFDMAPPLLARAWHADEKLRVRVIAAIVRVEVSAQKLRLVLQADAVDRAEASVALRDGSDIVLERPVSLARPRNTTTIVGVERSAARVDRTLIRAVALARHWADQLETGAVRSVVDLAVKEKRCIQYTNRLLPLAYLAPDLVDMILAGKQPPGLTLSALLAKPIPLGWDAQRAFLRRLA